MNAKTGEQDVVYLTADGAERLRHELDDLVRVRRPALAERLRKAIGQGDLSENADYTTAKEEQGFLEGRIQLLQVMLRKAAIIEEVSGPADRVSLGNRVVVVEDGMAEEEVYHIVGPAEADPTNGKVSHESPMGQALLGHQVGDVVTVQAPGGEIGFRIVAIR